MATTRIYVVGTDERLIEATNTVQARNHVAKHTIPVRRASQQDLVRLLTAGARTIEKAVEDDTTQEMPLGVENA